MACIRTHLISGASAVSLVSRPEDRTRLLSSSLRSFSGPAQLRWPRALLFGTGVLGGAWERRYVSLARQPQQLHEQHALLSLLSWACSACVFCAVLFQRRDALSRSILRFSFRLLRCLRGLSQVTSRTRLHHIDNPRSFTS